MSITVVVGGVTNVLEYTNNLTNTLRNKAVARMSEVAYDSMYAAAGKHFKTGKLQQSVFNRPFAGIEGARVVGHDGEYLKRATGTNYAPYVVHGFRAFGTSTNPAIKPKNKKALRWVGAGGDFVFAKFVRYHPGYVGDNYVEKAANEAVSKLRDIIDELIKEKP